MTPLKVITLFSGYDSQCLALNRLGVDYDLVAWCEIDKHAINAHNALFPQYADRNLGDISTVDWSATKEPIDLLTYSSPCQDFSSAGLQRGGDEGSGTRSGLLWEVEKAIKALRPRYLVFENVAALVSDKFIGVFNKWQARLNEYGYTNFQQLMNAKDYGVPQNRLRIFMVSVLNCNKQYHFPKPFKLEKRLKDVLEQNVDERYYLSDERVAKLMQETAIHSDRGNGFAFRPNTPEEIASTVKCSGIGDKTDNFIAEPQMLGWTRNEKSEITDRHPVSIANCVTAAKRDNTQNYVMEPTIAAMRGRDKDNPNDRGKSTDNYAQRLELKSDGTSNTLTTVAKDNLLVEPAILAPVRTEYGKAVRKLYGDNNLPESRHNLTVLQPKQDGTSNTLTSVTKDNLLIEPRCQQIGNLKDDSNSNFKNPQTDRVYSSEGLSPTINTCQGGQREPKIVEPTICGLPHGYYKGDIYTEYAPAVKSSGYAANNPIIVPQNINNELTRVFTDINEANTREALRLLWQEVGTQTFCEKMGRLGRFQETQVLQQGVHEEGFCENGHDNTEQRHGSQLGETHSVNRGEQGESMRGVRKERGETGCASQGRKLEEQFLGEFNDCLSQLPHETPQTEECMRYLRQADGRWTWLLQQTLSTLEEIRQSTDGERKNCQGIRIRRLSERELYRLMDLDESDIDTLLNSGIAKTQHAKLAGNSIVVSCLYYIFDRLLVHTEAQENEQLTLF